MVTPSPTNRALNYRQTEAARITTRDEMLKMRMKAIAEANKAKASAVTPVITNQVQDIPVLIPDQGTNEIK
jgi:hypothetical protein